MTIPFPYMPIQAHVLGNLAFIHTDTGEILEFDSSYIDHLDRVEQILWDNHNGNYIAYYPTLSEGIVY